MTLVAECGPPSHWVSRDEADHAERMTTLFVPPVLRRFCVTMNFTWPNKNEKGNNTKMSIVQMRAFREFKNCSSRGWVPSLPGLLCTMMVADAGYLLDGLTTFVGNVSENNCPVTRCSSLKNLLRWRQYGRRDDHPSRRFES